MNPQPKVRITEVKFNGRVIWRDPTIEYEQIIDKTEKQLETSELKEAKDIIAKVMERK